MQRRTLGETLEQIDRKTKDRRDGDIPSVLALILLIAGLWMITVAVGGVRPVFSLPAYGVIALGCVCGVFSKSFLRFKTQPRAVVCMLLFLGWMVGRALTTGEAHVARFGLDLAIAVGVVYLLTVFSLTSQRWRMAVVWSLLVLMVAQAVVGGIQFSLRHDFMLFGLMRPGENWRASGFLAHATHFAGFLGMVLPFGLALTIWSRAGVFWKVLSGYLCLVCLAAVAIAGSRGGYFAAGGAVLVVILLSLWVGVVTRRADVIRTGVLVLVGAVGIVGGTWWYASRSPVIQERFAQMVDDENIRYRLWESGFTQFLDEPVVGTGAGTFLHYGRLYRPLHPRRHGKQIIDPVHVHNDYIQLLAEYGAIGFGLFLLAFASHAGGGLRQVGWIARRRLTEADGQNSDSLALQMGALGALAAMALHSFVDFNMHIPSNTLLMAFVLGVLASPGTERRRSGERSGTMVLLPRLAVLAVSVAALGVMAPRIPGEWYAERARVALRDGDFARAVGLAREGIRWSPDHPELWFHWGEARLFQSAAVPYPVISRALCEEAVEKISRGLELHTKDMWRWINLGQALDGAGRLDAAEDAYRTAISLDPRNGHPYEYLALHYERRGELRQALRYYRKVLGMRSGRSFARENARAINRHFREQK